MKSFIFFLFLSVTVVANTAIDDLKKNLSKEWKIQQYETFSVQEMPGPDQINDKIHLKEDMTFFIIENGKEYVGKWTIISPANYISCKSSSGELNKMYKIISCTDKEAVLEYKDPDLIKTKYYLSAN